MQSSFGHDKLGIVTSSMQLFRNIGATMGTAFLGALIINHLEKSLQSLSLDILGIKHLTVSELGQAFQRIESAQPHAALLTQLRSTFAHAVSHAFYLCTMLCILIFIVVAFLPVIKLRKTNKDLNQAIS